MVVHHFVFGDGQGSCDSLRIDYVKDHVKDDVKDHVKAHTNDHDKCVTQKSTNNDILKNRYDSVTTV